MPEFFGAIALPLCAGLLLSLGIDFAYVQRGWLRRPLASWLVHAALMTLAFCIELLVFHRPWFAFSQMLVLQLVVIAVSAVKMSSLREPFVFQDFEYFIDMLRHPRLYIPFFGIGKLFAILAAVGVMIWVCMRIESSLIDTTGYLGFAIGWMLLTAIALALLWLGSRYDFAPSFDPVRDLEMLGLSGSLAAYAVAENDHRVFHSRFAQLPLGDTDLPHIVAVQSESFFDARRVHAGIHPDVYAWLDRVMQGSVAAGQLHVPAWGANTVRTEFGFLSGLTAEALGVHRFNPYRKLARRGVQTLAYRLREAGYRTICVHPYVARFYERDMVFPEIGFDEFIDIEAFTEQDKFGPYVGDQAVADKVSALLEASGAQPLFVFVISMENHGPLHLEKVGPEDEKALYLAPPPSGCDDLTVYLRHIRNAGRMQEKLSAALSAQVRGGWLCWYGDHVPILPKVYQSCGFDDARTDYFIWSSKPPQTPPLQGDLDVADLAVHMLQHMAPKG